MHVVGESSVIVKESKSRFLQDIQVFSYSEYENWFLESNLFVCDCVYVCLYVYT
jgi:hypothetical protein